MTDAGRAVFLSYASQDGEAAARICAGLRAAGIEVWFDQSELRGGEAWDRQIRKQIQECALFIAIISAHSDERAEGYFRREWRLAVERTHDMSDRIPFVVPVVIDNTNERHADVPESFLGVQWTRLPNGNTSPAFVERIQRLLSPEQQVTAASARPPPTAAQGTFPVRSRQSWRIGPGWWIGIVALIVVVIGAGYIAVERFAPSSRTTPPVNEPGAAAQAGSDAALDKSVAVLPFVDMSERKDQEYFADGLSEELANLLAKVPELRVAARTSSFYFKGKQATVAEVGKKLNVGNVIEGSVQKSGDAMRITVQLVQARNGFELWSERYDRKVSEIFKVQDEIAAAVVRALKLHLLSGALAPSGRAEHAKAYSELLQCRYLIRTAGSGGEEQARQCFERVVVEDPSYALAWASLPAILPASDPRVCESARRARDLDPRLPDAHTALGVCAISNWDWAGAGVEFRRALALDANNISAIRFEALLALVEGRLDEAIALHRRTLERDPVSVGAWIGFAWALWFSGKSSEAEQAARTALEYAPNNGEAQLILGMALLDQGQPAAALTELQNSPDISTRLGGTAIVYFATGRRADSDRALKELVKSVAANYPAFIGYVYAYRSEPDAAFAWFEHAYQQRDDVLEFVKVQKLVDPIGADPRYKAWLTKLNFPQ